MPASENPIFKPIPNVVPAFYEKSRKERRRTSTIWQADMENGSIGLNTGCRSVANATDGYTTTGRKPKK